MATQLEEIEKRWRYGSEYLKHCKHILPQDMKDIHWLMRRLKELEEQKKFLTIQNSDLREDLKFNASMLARQTDLAREAETRVKELEVDLCKLEKDIVYYKQFEK